MRLQAYVLITAFACLLGCSDLTSPTWGCWCSRLYLILSQASYFSRLVLPSLRIFQASSWGISWFFFAVRPQVQCPSKFCGLCFQSAPHIWVHLMLCVVLSLTQNSAHLSRTFYQLFILPCYFFYTFSSIQLPVQSFKYSKVGLALPLILQWLPISFRNEAQTFHVKSQIQSLNDWAPASFLILSLFFPLIQYPVTTLHATSSSFLLCIETLSLLGWLITLSNLSPVLSSREAFPHGFT